MVSEEIELIADINDVDIDELIDNRTSVSPEELQEEVEDYLSNLIGAPREEYDSRYARGNASKIGTTTYKQRAISLDKFVEWYEENERTHINTNTIGDFLNDMVDEGYAETTLETRYWQMISFFEEQFNATIENQVRDIEHTEIIKQDDTGKRVGKGARPIKQEEKEAMKETTENPRVEKICELLWQTGMRAKEVCDLKLNDVELEENTIHVETAKRDDDERPLKINLKLKNELRKWLDAERERYTQAGNSDYVFPTHKSNQMWPRNLTHQIRELADEAGIQDYNQTHQNDSQRAEITVHSFRKAFGLRRLRRGANVRQVQVLLGHSDISTTQEYLELQEQDLDYTPQS